MPPPNACGAWCESCPRHLDGTFVEAFTTIYRSYCHVLPQFGQSQWGHATNLDKEHCGGVASIAVSKVVA
jgi:hypothetical protein